VVTLLDTVLEGIIDFYRQESTPLPDKRYWAIGDVSADCEQLTVTLVQTYLGLPGTESFDPVTCNSPRTAVIGIQILRKVPVVGPTGKNVPTSTSIQELSVGPAIDAWMLMDALAAIDIFNSQVVLSINAVAPQGGLHGIIATYAMQIP
jgi:hypothetical protein